ncbi:hypothetical protein V8E54_007840 [Elaphomyces granulatus]
MRGKGRLPKTLMQYDKNPRRKTGEDRYEPKVGSGTRVRKCRKRNQMLSERFQPTNVTAGRQQINSITKRGVFSMARARFLEDPFQRCRCRTQHDIQASDMSQYFTLWSNDHHGVSEVPAIRQAPSTNVGLASRIAFQRVPYSSKPYYSLEDLKAIFESREEIRNLQSQGPTGGRETSYRRAPTSDAERESSSVARLNRNPAMNMARITKYTPPEILCPLGIKRLKSLASDGKLEPLLGPLVITTNKDIRLYLLCLEGMERSKKEYTRKDIEHIYEQIQTLYGVVRSAFSKKKLICVQCLRTRSMCWVTTHECMKECQSIYSLPEKEHPYCKALFRKIGYDGDKELEASSKNYTPSSPA